MAQTDDIDWKLSQLDCPFSWDMKQYEAKDDYNLDWGEEIISIKFMKLIMNTYIRTLKFDYFGAEESLKEAEIAVSNFDNSLIDVAKHILESTKCHVQMKKGNLNEARDILNKIKSIKDEIYESSLNELKCCAWTTCRQHTPAINMAKNFAKLTLELNPNSATCHFLLAKNIRRERRLLSFRNAPEDEEIAHFKKAYELLKNPEFGIFRAKMLKESGQRKEACNIFKEIASMNIDNIKVQMHLALALTQLEKFNLAKQCLDFIESKCPENSRFLHYKGIYLMKTKNFEEASKYLMEAKKSKNYGADLMYAKCMRQLGRRFNFPEYFISVLKKYSDSENPKKQDMCLHIAFSYFWYKRDIREAITYFLRAFEIDTKQDLLEKYHNPIRDTSINVYKFLEEDLLPKVENYRKSKIITLSEETILASEKLKQYCEDYETRRTFE